MTPNSGAATARPRPLPVPPTVARSAATQQPSIPAIQPETDDCCKGLLRSHALAYTAALLLPIIPLLPLFDLLTDLIVVQHLVDVAHAAWLPLVVLLVLILQWRFSVLYVALSPPLASQQSVRLYCPFLTLWVMPRNKRDDHTDEDEDEDDDDDELQELYDEADACHLRAHEEAPCGGGGAGTGRLWHSADARGVWEPPPAPPSPPSQKAQPQPSPPPSSPGTPSRAWHDHARGDWAQVALTQLQRAAPSRAETAATQQYQPQRSSLYPLSEAARAKELLEVAQGVHARAESAAEQLCVALLFELRLLLLAIVMGPYVLWRASLVLMLEPEPRNSQTGSNSGNEKKCGSRPLSGAFSGSIGLSQGRSNLCQRSSGNDVLSSHGGVLGLSSYGCGVGGESFTPRREAEESKAAIDRSETELRMSIVLTMIAAALASAPMLLLQGALFALSWTWHEGGLLTEESLGAGSAAMAPTGASWRTAPRADLLAEAAEAAEAAASPARVFVFSNRVYIASLVGSAGAVLMAVMHAARHRKELVELLWPTVDVYRRLEHSGPSRLSSRLASLYLHMTQHASQSRRLHLPSRRQPGW